MFGRVSLSEQFYWDEEKIVMSQTVPMTPEGHQRLQEELKQLMRVERPKVVQDIAEARAHGDLSENAEYDAAKNRQGFVEGRIAEINGKMAHAQVIDVTEIDTDKVVFGTTVKLFDVESESESEYRIVGQDEADIKLGLISINSPVAKALIGHRVDDEVHIKVPSGTRIYEIIEIQYL
jgi:transcription elongation factor GreA